MRGQRSLLFIVLWFALDSTQAAPTWALSPQAEAARLCRAKLTAAGKAYANTRRKLLLSCAGKLLKCALQEEIDKINVKTCVDSAKASCIAKLNTAGQGLPLAQQKFIDKGSLGCTAMGVTNVCSTGAGGLWFGNDLVCGTSNANTCGAMADLPTLLACVRGQIETEVDRNVSRVAPRAGMLLDNVGLGSLFPNLVRPPTTTVMITATSNGSGVLNNPGGGTISLSAGNSLTLVGDNVSLPCGSNNNNGKLTISLGSGTSCTDLVPIKTLEITEPYGPAQAVVVGPFNDDVNYCINLKDGGSGGCAPGSGNRVFGTVDVDVPTPQPTPPTSMTVMFACHRRLQGKLKSFSSYDANKLHACGDKVAKCELAKEIDGATACTQSYTTPCSTIATQIATKLAASKGAITSAGKCPTIPFAHLRSFVGGLGFANSATGCASAANLSDLVDCVLGTPNGMAGAKCSVEDKSFLRDPRLLDSLSVKAGLNTATGFACIGP